jgi:hypothetical protein
LTDFALHQYFTLSKKCTPTTTNSQSFLGIGTMPNTLPFCSSPSPIRVVLNQFQVYLFSISGTSPSQVTSAVGFQRKGNAARKILSSSSHQHIRFFRPKLRIIEVDG